MIYSKSKLEEIIALEMESFRFVRTFLIEIGSSSSSAKVHITNLVAYPRLH